MSETVKYGAWVTISREMAVDHGLVEPTAEERARMDESKAAWEAREAKAAADLERFRLELLQAVGIAYARARDDFIEHMSRTLDVLGEHGEVEPGYCKASVDDELEGCACPQTDQGEPQAWPCIVTETVARILGVEPPADVWEFTG